MKNQIDFSVKSKKAGNTLEQLNQIAQGNLSSTERQTLKNFYYHLYEAQFSRLTNLLKEFENFWTRLLELIEDEDERIDFKKKAEGYVLHVFEHNIMAPFMLELDLLLEGKIKAEDSTYFTSGNNKNFMLDKDACMNRIANGTKLAFLQLDFAEQLVSGKKIRIKNLQREKELLHEKLESFRPSDSKNYKHELENVNRELSNAHTIIVNLKSKTKTLESGLSQSKLYEIIGSKKCRKKNGVINYSKLGKELGVSHHTAQERCKKFEIS